MDVSNDKKKYLGEIIEGEHVSLDGKKNMIISPVGSGKTYFIFNTLGSKYKGPKLILASTTALKDSLTSRYSNALPTKDYEDTKDKDNMFHVMTYAEFGKSIMWDDDFIDNYQAIFCDEIHSLFDYFSFSKSYILSIVIRALFVSKVSKVDFYYFTATADKIREFMNSDMGDKGIMKDVFVVNYLKRKDIVSHESIMNFKFRNDAGILELLDNLSESSRIDNKGLIFNDRIKGMKRIENLLSKKGYKVISIWSINNAKNPMSKEQLEVRDYILRTGMLPDKYDFIIINGAMREGWDLLDKRVQVVILNTADETSKIQARGRVRHDIAIFAEKMQSGHENINLLHDKIITRENTVRAVGSRLNSPLTMEIKSRISEELSVYDYKNRLVKWPTIQKSLEINGYKIEKRVLYYNGSQIRVDVITNEELNPIIGEALSNERLVEMLSRQG